MARRADDAAPPRQTLVRAAVSGAVMRLRHAGACLARFFRRPPELPASRNARMPGESACRLCGICHHLCGMIAASPRPGGSPKE